LMNTWLLRPRKMAQSLLLPSVLHHYNGLT
jgi:hypothetical protein